MNEAPTWRAWKKRALDAEAVRDEALLLLKAAYDSDTPEEWWASTYNLLSKGQNDE